MKIKGKKFGILILFILPALFFYGIFNVIGIIRTFYFSLMEWKGISSNMQFIGLNNYIELINDAYFWSALRNNLILVLVSILVQMPGALMLAVLINKEKKGVRLFRTIFFMPMLLSTVATGIMWILFYDPYFGLMNNFLNKLGFKSVAFLTGGTALPSILFVICWQFIPFYMIILKAGMTNIPADVYESAKIDGATGAQAFFKITLPLLMPTIRSSAVLQLVGSLKYFDLFYVMMGGAPNASTELMATYMFKKGFTEFRMGYASSIAGSMFIISFVIACLFLIITNKKEVA